MDIELDTLNQKSFNAKHSLIAFRPRSCLRKLFLYTLFIVFGSGRMIFLWNRGTQWV